MGDLNGYFGELGQEMKAISDYLEIDLGVVVALNFAYELRRVSRYCNICLHATHICTCCLQHEVFQLHVCHIVLVMIIIVQCSQSNVNNISSA